MSDHSALGRSKAVIAKIRAATVLTVRRRDARRVAATVTVAYLLLYLWALGHLAPGLGGYSLTIVEVPLSKLFRPALGPLAFTPVATVELGPLTYLFSLNSIIGLGLAVLVGLNLGLTYLVWTQPRACGLGRSSTGFIASIPAILSGTACCGPVVLIVLGIQASGVLLTTFQFLLPISVVLLLGSLVLVARQIDPQQIDSVR
ncbi:hypothetical protein [Halomicrobium sp. LC1Hm]|uniref:hypothetical protein n=1 Tax=Halomicrobium sp. LC1Hm TaxID=2610902 RepID=UPI0012984C2F|nr:hypothetical protein [Halomicrobium sp. LC1Hm]QGA84073.1 putative membrane protein [Halomicrobium sp. LC1Hm]